MMVGAVRWLAVLCTPALAIYPFMLPAPTAQAQPLGYRLANG